ncbi:MAG: SDR family oxidoreductase [Sumerlaeia bacterium]
MRHSFSDSPHVLLTGATGGIGQATAEAFLRAGARLSLVARSGDALDALAQRLGRNLSVAAADVTDRSQLAVALTELRKVNGPVDILVNNAGVGNYDHFHEMEPPLIEQLLRVNLEGAINLSHLVLPEMQERAQGTMIHVASNLGHRPLPFTPVYSAAKAGLIRFSEAIAKDYGKAGIRSMVVSPAKVDTRFGGRSVQGPQDTSMLQPEDVADAILYCAATPPNVVVLEMVVVPREGAF